VTHPIPAEVEKLIAGHIDSVEKLEVLLFLRGEHGRTWKPAEVSRELRRNPTSVDRCMAQLSAGGLLSTEAGEYRFQPRNAALRTQVDALADTYATRRVSVVQLIVRNPMDSVTTFADAFRFRRKKDDDG
jgi:DNA-binding IclR family transcriptional regulator